MITAALRTPLLLPLALLATGMAVGALSAYDPSLSLPVAASLWAGVLLFLAIVGMARSARARRGVAAAIVGFAALYSLICFAQYRHLGFERKIEALARLGELTSMPFPALPNFPFQQNMAAATLEGVLPIAIGLAATARGRARALWGGAAALIGAGLVLGVSRGAWAALAGCVLLAALAALGRRRPRLVAVGLAGCALLVGLIGLGLLTPWGQEAAGPLLARGGSRLSLYRTALPLALDTAFSGIGPGDTFAMIYSRYGLLIQVPYLTYAHSLPLAVWMGGGALGLLGLGLLTIGAGRLFWRAGVVGAGPLWLGAALGSLALLLHGLVDAPQYNAGGYAMLMAWAVLGLATAEARAALEPAEAPSRPWDWRHAGALAAVALLAILLWRPLAAQAAVNLGAVAEARADLAPDRGEPERAALRARSADWYRQAMQLVPGHPGAARRLGVQALDARRFDEAAGLLELAHAAGLAPETSAKALGYAYLWGGRVDEATALFAGLERRAELRAELDVYAWWWAAEAGRPDLAEHAAAAARALDAHAAHRP